MATVRLTVTLDVPEETTARAICALLEWPTSSDGPGNMVYHITHGPDNREGYAYQESVGKAVLAAILQAQPEIAQDITRSNELAQRFWGKYFCKFGCLFKDLVQEDVESLREYIELQIKYQVEDKHKEGWRKRLEEINEAAEALKSVPV